MLTTTLLLMFSGADVRSAFLSDGAPRSVRLVVEATPPPSDLPSYTGWNKRQLQQEYDRLAELRPGIAMPITLMGTGGGVLFVSAYLGLLALLSSGGRISSSAVPLVALLGVVGIGGAAMLIIGGILMYRTLPERRSYSVQMDEVDRLIKEMPENQDPQPDERRYVPPAPPPIIGPPPEGPPPLPLPPSAPQASVQFPLIFARF